MKHPDFDKVKNNLGETPLHTMTRHALNNPDTQKEVLDKLMKHPAFHTVMNNKNQTPFHALAENHAKNKDIVKTIVEHPKTQVSDSLKEKLNNTKERHNLKYSNDKLNDEDISVMHTLFNNNAETSKTGLKEHPLSKLKWRSDQPATQEQKSGGLFGKHNIQLPVTEQQQQKKEQDKITEQQNLEQQKIKQKQQKEQDKEQQKQQQEKLKEQQKKQQEQQQEQLKEQQKKQEQLKEQQKQYKEQRKENFKDITKKKIYILEKK